MNGSSQHPSGEILRAFSEGRVSGDELAEIERHLESCPACCNHLDEAVDEDPLVSRLKSAASSLGGSASPTALPERESNGPPAAPGYEILAELGRGGMGVVYKARQVGLNRLVALKVLLSGAHASPEDQVRFRAEAAALARIKHPNIVQVYDTATHDGMPCFALEFVEGGSLAEHLRGRSLAPRLAAELSEIVARAVHAAHEQGVIHRDLKPANVLLAPVSGRGVDSGTIELPGTRLGDGEPPPNAAANWMPKVTDFGLAKCLDHEAGLTRTGTVAGTPNYMAPEQALGHASHVGPAADIYGLGATLYELLTGRPPFQGPTPMETIQQVCAHEPVSPRRLQPKVPRDLETICLKCLAKEPRRRYASALELAEDLRRFRNGEPVRARRVGAVGQTSRWCRRNPGIASLLAALAAVIVVGFVGITASYLNARQAREHETDARKNEERQRERAEDHLYFSRIALADREWLANEVARADHLLDLCRPADGQPDRRAWEWHYLKRLCHADLFTVQAHSFPVYSLAFHPGGMSLLSAAGDPGYNRDPRTTPGELTLWDTTGFEKLRALRGHTGQVSGAGFSRDGAAIVSLGADNTVRLWKTDDGEEQSAYSIDGPVFWRGTCASLAPHGTLLAMPDNQVVKLIDSTTGAVAAELSLPGRASHVAFNPDATQLAVGVEGIEGGVHVWHVADRRLLYRVAGAAHAATFSPDGQFLATIVNDSIKVWAASSGAEVVTLRGHTGFVKAIAWDEQGEFLASAAVDRTVRVWQVRTGREHRIFRGHDSQVTSVAFHPDGRRIASGDMDGVIKVWDVDRGQRVREMPEAPQMCDVAFSADGRSVLAVGPADSRATILGWEALTGRETLNIPCGLAPRTEWPLRYMAFGAAGRLFAAPTPQDPSAVRVLDVTTGQEVTTLRAHQNRVRAVAISIDGRLVATASGAKDAVPPRELFVWRLPEPSQVVPPPLAVDCPAPAQCLAFSADGRRLAVGERGVWSPDTQRSTNGFISVWDTTTGQLIKRWLAHPGPVQTVAFDSSGRWLASGGRALDRSVCLWDADTGSKRHELQGPDAHTGLSFSPDGRRLAAVGYDGIIHLWDPETRHDILTLRGPGPQLLDGVAYDSNVVFSPDGTLLAVNTWMSTVRIWDGRPQLEPAEDAIRER